MGAGCASSSPGSRPAPCKPPTTIPRRGPTRRRARASIASSSRSRPRSGSRRCRAAEAAPLLDAFNRGILELGGPFELWAAAQTPAELDALLDAGARGLTLPAAALIDGRADALLDRLEARDAPLFVHPGPVAAGSADAPAWWPAMTDYVAQMSAAWHAFAGWGRPRHPRLRVVFAMLAGCGPLHAERLAARGGPAEAIHDPLVWFDSSSYGARTLDSMLRMVGVDRLVHGSDRPGHRGIRSARPR